MSDDARRRELYSLAQKVGVLVSIYEMTRKGTWDWSVDFDDTGLSQSGTAATFDEALGCVRDAYANGRS